MSAWSERSASASDPRWRLAPDVTTIGPPVGGTLANLSHRRSVEPLAELAITAVLEAVEMLDHLATGRLHHVRNRLAAANDGTTLQAHEGSEVRKMPREQLLQCRRVPLPDSSQ